MLATCGSDTEVMLPEFSYVIAYSYLSYFWQLLLYFKNQKICVFVLRIILLEIKTCTYHKLMQTCNIPALKLAHNLMNCVQIYTFHKVVTCCCLRPKRLDSHRGGSWTRAGINPGVCLLIAWFIRGITSIWNKTLAGWCTYLLNNGTWTLLVDPHTGNRIDTGHQHSGL